MGRKPEWVRGEPSRRRPQSLPIATHGARVHAAGAVGGADA